MLYYIMLYYAKSFILYVINRLTAQKNYLAFPKLLNSIVLLLGLLITINRKLLFVRNVP